MAYRLLFFCFALTGRGNPRRKCNAQEHLFQENDCEAEKTKIEWRSQKSFDVSWSIDRFLNRASGFCVFHAIFSGFVVTGQNGVETVDGIFVKKKSCDQSWNLRHFVLNFHPWPLHFQSSPSHLTRNQAKTCLRSQSYVGKRTRSSNQFNARIREQIRQEGMENTCFYPAKN